MNHHPAKNCTHQWEHAIKNPGTVHQPKALIMAIQSTPILTVPNVALTAGVSKRVPATGGHVIPTNLQYQSFGASVNLTTDIKEAVGNILQLAVYRASDDLFIAGYPGPPDGGLWTSYGGELVSTAPDGTVTIDPDPTIVINVNNPLIAGQAIYVIATANWSGDVSVTVSGLG
jgi:hypothetical protein